MCRSFGYHDAAGIVAPMRESRSADATHTNTNSSRVETEDALGTLKPPPRSARALSGIVVREPQLGDRIRYFDHPLFHAPDAWERIVADPESQLPSPLPLSRRGSGNFASVLIYPPLAPEQTTNLFLRMNFLKFKAAQMIEAAIPAPLSNEQLSEAREYLKLAQETKDVLVASNLRIALSVANKFSRSLHVIEDLVSFGGEILMRATESFDCSRPYHFYAYARRALISNYSKLKKTGRVAEAASLPADAIYHEQEDVRSNELKENRNSALLSRSIEAILEALDERERTALTMRSLEEATFIEIGKKLGVSKQGAQGIVNRAILRLQQGSRVDPRDNLL
jgi:RNA polymerase sigma factor (sigma-70 family)